MLNFVFVVLCALVLVGGALGEAALGNYYKDVVREQHELINEMNQNFTELERASEKLIDLGFYVGKHKLPPKTVKITKTVAVQVPVPFPVKVPEPVPVPVPVAKPVPVPVPTLVAVPVESTVATVASSPTDDGGRPSPSAEPADADPASSQVHASTAQEVQEYVHSFPIHSVYDAGDDYNPMEGNRLALAEHTASPTESTFSKPSPSSLQQLEEYQHPPQYYHSHQRPPAQQPKRQHPQQHRKPTAPGLDQAAEQYHRGRTGDQRYGGGAQVQAGAHPAGQYGPEPDALQPAAEPYDFGIDASQLHSAAFARAPDTPYTVATGVAGGKPSSAAPSAPSAIGEGYRFATAHHLHQQQQRFQQRGRFAAHQYDRGVGGRVTVAGGVGGSGESGRVSGSDGGAGLAGANVGGVGGAGPETGSHSYVQYVEDAALQAHAQVEEVPRYQSEGETRLQAGFEAGFQAGLETTHQAGLEAGFQAGLEADQEAQKGAQHDHDDLHHHHNNHHYHHGKAYDHNDRTPRPFQTVRESYPRYEKPDAARYPPSQSTAGDARGSAGGVLSEAYDHPAFAKSHRPAAATGPVPTAATVTSTATTHGYPVPGERSLYPSLSTAGHHHTHPHPAHLPGEAHQDLRDQAHHDNHDDDDGAGSSGQLRFPFYHATKHDPHLVRAGVESYRAGGAPTSGPSYQLRQQYGEHAQSSTGDRAAQTVHHHHHAGASYHSEHGGDQFGQQYKGSYPAKPTVYSVPSDAHLYPEYGGSHSDNHHQGGGHDDHGTTGKFHYHFHNVHPIGGGNNDHHHQQQSSASEHHYTAVHGGHASAEYGGGAAGPDGSVVSSYDPPASGSAFHFHDDASAAASSDVYAGASTQYGHSSP
ncbi:uncharacterized protein LOC133393096 isoform X1 [Anopheles gambiae]|uniref:uncharacterized protein LOC133393096 isoform X1 n=1 Tax=Anopheles gambiae TaxID=7165 RepID=UPI002AC9D86F|nr:uncharacterized protein LOC133393096 isoform X1 [Anopheles gambiae]